MVFYCCFLFFVFLRFSEMCLGLRIWRQSLKKKQKNNKEKTKKKQTKKTFAFWVGFFVFFLGNLIFLVFSSICWAVTFKSLASFSDVAWHCRKNPFQSPPDRHGSVNPSGSKVSHPQNVVPKVLVFKVWKKKTQTREGCTSTFSKFILLYVTVDHTFGGVSNMHAQNHKGLAAIWKISRDNPKT